MKLRLAFLAAVLAMTARTARAEPSCGGKSGAGVWEEPVRFAVPSELAAKLREIFGYRDPAAAFCADDAKGVLIIAADEATYRRVIELLRHAPDPPRDGGEVHVLPLRHADAADVARALAQITRAGVVADRATNALVVTARAEDHATIARAVASLDVARAKVLLDAVILELSPIARPPLGWSLHAMPVFGPIDGEAIPAFGAISERAWRAALRLAMDGDPRVFATPSILVDDGARAEVRIAGLALSVAPRLQASGELRLDLRARGEAHESSSMLVIRPDEAIAVHLFDRERGGRKSVHLVATPRLIHGEPDLRAIFAERLAARRVWLDRHALFAPELPPVRIDPRARGLIGEMRAVQRGR